MLKKILKWAGIVILVAYVALVVYRGFVLRAEEKTNEQVAKIHATKLTLDDVLGKNLPPEPNNPDSNVQGVDTNTNGIRDDVELAIFKEYPDSAKTRAVLLQYALALQMEVMQPIVNEGTVVAVAQDGDRALNCIWSISSREDRNKFREETTRNEDFVKLRQLNTEQRKKAQHDFYQGNLASYTSPNEGCDLDLAALPN